MPTSSTTPSTSADSSSTTNRSPEDRDVDVVVFGATGFTGRLVAAYLGEQDTGLRVALAGRSQQKLDAVRQEISQAVPAVAEWETLHADSSDEASLREMARRARVVCTTVGPYTEYGLPVVQACAEAGTHYADLSGEVLFMRDSIDRFDATARESGARIVHACGFDSIPSDLGVHVLAEAVRADGEGNLGETRLVVTRAKGGISGGTIASGQATAADAASSRERARVLSDAYSLSPDRDAEPDHGDEREVRGVSYDDVIDTWVGPFLMASINTRVVRRTNALSDYAYGRTFRYSEVMGTGRGATGKARAAALAAGTGVAGVAMSFGATRSAAKVIVPPPGTGPDEKARREGFFTIAIRTETTTGARYVCRVHADGDPGYQATAMMLGEAATCLARCDDLPDVAGVLTPATAMGSALVGRLRAAGMTFEVERQESGSGD